MQRSKIAPLLFLLLVSCRSSLTVEDRALQLTERAKKHEPSVTPVLVKLSEELGGEMYKIEYRLKSLKSTTRKLKKELKENPGAPIEKMELDDTLRYTMRFEDEPPGHHVASIQKVLGELEGKGHAVVVLKNYWPPNDNYSGVNSILHHPAGFDWELQFHTKMSLQVQLDTRPQYEEIRKVDTSLERKRELFDQMTEAWSKVPIPEGILEEKNLHEREDIRDRKRP